MERVSSQAKSYIMMITAIAVVLFGYTLLHAQLESVDKAAVIILGMMAVGAELWAVSIPYFSFASVAFCIYFAAIILFGPALAALFALCGTIARGIVISKDNFWYRLIDVSTLLLNVLLAGYVYTLVRGPDDMFSARSLMAMLISWMVFFGLDYVISATAVGQLAQSVQRSWYAIKHKARQFETVLAALGVLLAIACRQSPYLAVLLIPPLAGMRFALDRVIKDIVVRNQEMLERSLRTSQNELAYLKDMNHKLSADLQRKVDELSILFEMGQALGARLDMDSILEVVVQMLRRLVYYQSCVIFLIKEDKLFPARYATPHREALELAQLLQLDEGVVRLVRQSMRPLLVADVQTEEESRIFKDEKSVMCAPLVIQNEILGVIYVGGTNPHTYNETHLHSLTIIANSAAISIRSAQLYAITQQALEKQTDINAQLDVRVQQMSALFQLGQALGRSLDLETTLSVIVEMTRKIIPYQSFIIFMLKEEGGRRDFAARKLISPYSRYFENLTFPVDDGVLGWVATNQKPMLLEDTNQSRLASLLEYERSVIAVPLIVENEVTGALYLGSAKPGAYQVEQMALVSTVAYQAAMAIKNAELYERMTKLAITDGVTGLYTHRYFQERLEEEMRWAARYNQPLTLVMVDTDHFKKYNDTLGHPEGDKALQAIAGLLRSYTRESDLVCRYGGDEFALVLKEIDKENALRIAERIRQGMQLRFNQSPVKLTLSIGVASFPEDAKVKKDLVACADTALYRSKESGRNQVTAAFSSLSFAGEAGEAEGTVSTAQAPTATPAAQSDASSMPGWPEVPPLHFKGPESGTPHEKATPIVTTPAGIEVPIDPGQPPWPIPPAYQSPARTTPGSGPTVAPAYPSVPVAPRPMPAAAPRPVPPAPAPAPASAPASSSPWQPAPGPAASPLPPAAPRPVPPAPAPAAPPPPAAAPRPMPPPPPSVTAWPGNPVPRPVTPTPRVVAPGQNPVPPASEAAPGGGGMPPPRDW